MNIKFLNVKDDDTTIVKRSESYSIMEHVEAFITKNAPVASDARTQAYAKLMELTSWIDHALTWDQMRREQEHTKQEAEAKARYDEAERKRIADEAKRSKTKVAKKKGKKK